MKRYTAALFLSRYRCPECSHGWENYWSCPASEDCPACGHKEIEPQWSEPALNNNGGQA